MKLAAASSGKACVSIKVMPRPVIIIIALRIKSGQFVVGFEKCMYDVSSPPRRSTTSSVKALDIYCHCCANINPRHTYVLRIIAWTLVGFVMIRPMPYAGSHKANKANKTTLKPLELYKHLAVSHPLAKLHSSWRTCDCTCCVKLPASYDSKLGREKCSFLQSSLR